MAENEKKKPMHQDHRARMQARVARDGLDSLAEHEALEYLLFFAIPRRDTNPLAHNLIDHFGNFCKVLEADEKELCEVEGIGPSSARLIHAVLEFSRYYMKSSRKTRVALNLTENAKEYVVPMFLGKKTEAMYVIAMDDKYFPMRIIQAAEGIPNQVRINRVKLLRDVVSTGCTCVLITHNHPQGIAMPSSADLISTQQIVNQMNSVGVAVIDHIIVAGSETYSMQEMGKLPYPK